MMQIVVIAGNIGAGKSTTLDALRQMLSNWPACFVPEPVEEWREKGFLEQFYKTGNAFEFQMQVLYSRIAAYEKAFAEYLDEHDQTLPSVVIMDRWVEEDFDFAKINFTRGAMTESQFGIYKMAYNYLLKYYPTPDVSIWLDVTPEDCLQRLQARGRPEEIAGISLEYLQEINKNREEYEHIVLVTPDVQPYEVALRILNIII